MKYISLAFIACLLFNTSALFASDLTLSNEEVTDVKDLSNALYSQAHLIIEKSDEGSQFTNDEEKVDLFSAMQQHMALYSESTERALSTIANAIDQWSLMDDCRPRSIIIGENHEAIGNAYFESVLLASLRSIGFNTVFSEISQNTFDTWKMSGDFQSPMNKITDILFDGKIKIAYGLGYEVIPFDVLDASTFDDLPSFKERLQAVLSHKREKQMIDKVRNYNNNFVCITGNLHLPGFVNDYAFNEKFNVLYINCAPIDHESAMKHFNLLRMAGIDPSSISYCAKRYHALKQAPIVQLPITINPGISTLGIFDLIDNGLDFHFMDFEIPEERKNEFYRCFPDIIKNR